MRMAPPSTLSTLDARFRTPRSTLLFDRLMTWFIKIGGMGVIVAVSAILVFILWQTAPLFRSARVTPTAALPLPAGLAAADIAVLGLDEWGEAPFVLGKDGTVTFFDAVGGHPARTVPLGLGAGKRLSAWRYDSRFQRLTVGGEDGTLAVFGIAYHAAFHDGTRIIEAAIEPVLSIPVGEPGRPLRAVAYAGTESDQVAVAIQDGADGKPRVLLAGIATQRSLLGKAEVKVDQVRDLTAQIPGAAELVRVDERGESFLVADHDGEITYFFKGDEGFQPRQKFRPFADADDARIASLDYLLGDVSLVLTNPAGLNRIFSLYHKDGSDTRLFGQTKEFERLPAGADGYAPSVRNKAFALTCGHLASLRYGTSAAIRWQEQLPYAASAPALSAKYERLALLGDDRQLHLFALDDPHPESGFASLFGKIWYEGADAPAYAWQSTGGSDDFEPKLSMVPLLAGTLKGTFYAILFAVPIALLGAIYTSEFMHPRFKTVIKPVVEIMASLPSVVLGFLAALWLAPLIEHRVPSLIMVFVLVPSGAMLFGWWWARLPMRWRSLIRPGYEFIAFTPLMVALAVSAWSLGPVLERLAFVIHDPATHAPIADFTRWWHETTGLRFEQRNSLVVGIIMGFAVIPLIFTITEDALANVPAALRSGSLALGASRWQTAIRVVVPTASAGIFSALMIGLGRAIGETMIVVMATGNTAVMNLDIFDGMRTLSANIAVELSEAPQNGTLFRTLFLGALLLFIMTFVINTAAELLRQHLREKYKTV
jgi:phosphate transport system permease protein